MTQRYLTVSAVLAALLLSACGNGGSDTAGNGPSAEHGNGHGSSSAADDATGNDADLAFLMGMKPHHEQAVEMSELVLAANPPAEVAAIATQIKNAQSPEIEQMNTMLDDLGASTDPAEHSGGHSAGHGGMMSDAELAALEDATGTEAARLYLEAMIEHHKGAIEASDTQIAGGRYGPAIELARQIKQAQAAEIAAMEKLVSTL